MKQASTDWNKQVLRDITLVKCKYVDHTGAGNSNRRGNINENGIKNYGKKSMQQRPVF
jgi:hypothetical protein